MSTVITHTQRTLIEGALKLARNDVLLSHNTRSIDRQQTLAQIDEALQTLTAADLTAPVIRSTAQPNPLAA